MPSILIIDDDHLVREATKAIFRTKGYDVVIAEDGKSGIEAARSNQFNVAIIDLFMPGMDGLKVVKAIRQSNPKLPIFVASGFMFGGECPTMPDFESMASEIGATGTLYKPFRPDILLQTVENALGEAG